MSRSMEQESRMARQYQFRREQADAATLAYSARPVATGQAVTDIYERLLEVEERLFPAGDYLTGIARVDDKPLVLHGLSRVLLTAEHAAIHPRHGKAKEADMGTGALAEVVAQDTNSTAIIAIGRQTGDANYEEDHPIKEAMLEVLRMTQNRAHLSIHMLDRGRASDILDERGYSVMLGIGKKPSEATLALKDFLVEVGGDLDLRVGVNQPHVVFDGSGNIKYNDDNTVKKITFAAAGPNTTRTFSQSTAEKADRDDAFAAVQVEINEVLLVRQNDEIPFPSQADREYGSYLGYLFTKLAVEKVANL